MTRLSRPMVAVEEFKQRQLAGAATRSRGQRDRVLARALLWVAFWLFVLGTGAGTAWDRRWHTTHRFDDFWSPPHLFIYANVLLTVGVVAYIAGSRRLRRRFGPGEQLPLVPFAVPAPLLFLGAGLAIVGLAGAFDATWHTAFGLDETNWSTPHAMLGRGIMLAFWGFAACRLALGRDTVGRRPDEPVQVERPLPWYTALLLGWVILAVTPNLLGGPILRNLPPRFLAAFAASPIAQQDPRLEHLFRIYLAWHLDRTNPLYLPMAAFVSGAGLAVLRGLVKRDDRFLAAAVLVGLIFPLLAGRAGGLGGLWLAEPYLPAAAALVASRRLGASDRWSWLLAGWTACAWSLVWVRRPLLAALAGPTILLGVLVGQVVVRIVERPARRPVLWLAAVVGLACPLLTGALDLYLRAHTP